MTEANRAPDARTVEAARAGDGRALDVLIGAYLPLVYNVVGRALRRSAEVDDVVQEVMFQAVRDLPQLRDPEAFRSWLVAIAMREVRRHDSRRRSAPDAAQYEADALADPGADFVDLTIAALGLSEQRLEVARATRWLDAEDRQLLSLWWLETAGHLTRSELAAAMDVSPAKAAVLVHRTKARLETARSVVRALAATPRCPELAGVCARWDGRPEGLWRKRIARHVRECPSCGLLQQDLVPAEFLLAGLALVPVAVGLRVAVTALTMKGVGSGSAALGRRAANRSVRQAAGRGHRMVHWTALSAAGKATVAGFVALAVVAGGVGIRYANASPARAADSIGTTTTTAPPTPGSSASSSPGASSPASQPTTTPKPMQPSSIPSSAPASSTIVNTALPVRAAFYYPWYPENFADNGSHYTPSAGDYSVDQVATVDRQIRDMQYGGLQAGIISWWGRGRREDKRTPLLMAEAAKLGFSWSAYYEQEAYGDPSSTQIADDLVYLRKYSDQKAWLHINGLPVIFVYADGSDGCGMATRWAEANRTAHYYVVLKVFGGYRQCADQPQGWHQYVDDLDVQNGYSAVTSPGFWKYDTQTPAVPRDPARFKQDVTTVARSGDPFQLIISYNEWGEGTAAESATAWASPSGHGVYMDILHQAFGQYPR
jgi:RNA polymerase sigma factor (sigma-70 family)